MTISQTICDFTTLAIEAGGWMEMDRIYLQNKILGMIGEDALETTDVRPVQESSLDLLDRLVEQAQKNEVISSSIAEKEMFEAQLMDFLTPPPSVVNAFFAQHYANSPEEATEYFYQLSQRNDYIKTRAIAKNIKYTYLSEYGELEITINLSKPEKDPKQIIAQRKIENVDYPKCMLCLTNEGYKGRLNYPARTNHRIIRMNLDGESWGFQYSPYAYYNEHSIILSEEHRPMKITKETFARLLKITEVLPHYFVGSNADLPIVGGSILSHDHYQAGRHEFPMAKAPIERLIKLSDYPQVIAGILKWPVSVIRLQATDKDLLIAAATSVLDKWKNYSDPTVDVLAYSADGTSHHTITPIARKKENYFELDLVLRDNNVSKEHPEGIFHPHRDIQHIKKENIGLIEVMGLAVLPPRLKSELTEVENYLLGKENNVAAYHIEWASQLKAENPNVSQENVSDILYQAVGKVFARVLEDAGVFKRDEKGQMAFQRFTETL
ncbi:UDP-glucose--hexose-1-phosphate uridylyltransferase [Enterococcus villorum]|uniref:Galactose-1-phosphate uridylyltransferase n=2 Tax=Enterococcus villorum TaxID=112904 RepID=A0A511J064_9ENTE|nr:UDP-glucose--hexose-1-phosphate uridylyltransferase [Enterococcus villorum]EOH87573.1 galactose-1-phosphate uridylyltransferase [Enterococcus villorum ATCC 700913]EOW77708.1 galactose-1-phosphate uridylyltransferase [Enterococcus villorum ATCC 700913]GEL91387.1 galactose-1-phosphate uridylyltransferase [Enterococcus villorum]